MTPLFEFTLSNQLISQDIFTVFLDIIISAMVLGIIIGLFVRFTWWLWY